MRTKTWYNFVRVLPLRPQHCSIEDVYIAQLLYKRLHTITWIVHKNHSLMKISHKTTYCSDIDLNIWITELVVDLAVKVFSGSLRTNSLYKSKIFCLKEALTGRAFAFSYSQPRSFIIRIKSRDWFSNRDPDRSSRSEWWEFRSSRPRSRPWFWSLH